MPYLPPKSTLLPRTCSLKHLIVEAQVTLDSFFAHHVYHPRLLSSQRSAKRIFRYRQATLIPLGFHLKTDDLTPEVITKIYNLNTIQVSLNAISEQEWRFQ